MESVTILTRTSRSKKLEVKGGFYSKEDMKNRFPALVYAANAEGPARMFLSLELHRPEPYVT